MLLFLRSQTVVVVAALLGLMLWAGEPLRLSWWAGAVPFALWITAPAILPYLVARRLRERRWVALAMSCFLLISTGWSATVYYQAFFVSASSTAALVMIFAPLYQLLALGCAAVLCLMAIAVGRRRDTAR